MDLEKLKNKQIAILGFWKEGKSSLRFLRRIWVNPKNITILDSNKNVEIPNDIKKNLWKSYLDNLWSFDIFFKTPWISPYHKKILPYKEKLISNAEIFFDKYKGKIIWITATKGKSTTSTLLFKTLQKAWYSTKLVWNIWNSIFDEVDLFSGEKYDFIVYELSSYMLETIKPELFVWILWNIYPCHIDWHNNSMEVYSKAKINILINAQNIIINENFIEYLDKYFENKNIKTFGINWYYSFDDNWFYINSEKIIKNKNIILAWEHNKYNISSVIWVLDQIWDKKVFKALKEVLAIFSWLAHRQEKIWTYKWITFIDDGISTTPESTIEAIKTFWKKIWTIFIWWSDYGFTDESFANLRSFIEKYKISNIVLFIETWSRVFWDISDKMQIWEEKVLYLENNYSPKVLKTNSMEQAIKFAYENTQKWQFCLLSSASPSFSLWKWYIQKGEQFKYFVEKYS